MQALINILWIYCISISFLSCEKSKSTDFGSSSIVGKWKLIEVYADPGDGSGKFTKVEGGKILEFSSDGEVSTNASLCSMISNGFLKETSSYIIKQTSDNKNTIKIEKCPTYCSYDLRGNQLTIYYPWGNEGYGERFIRIKD